MKALTFRKNSWHYFLAVTLGNFRPGRGDFCSYVRNAIFGSIIALLLLTVASFCLYCLGMEIRALYTCTFGTVCTFGKFEQTVVIVECVLIGVIAFIIGCIQFGNWRDRRDDRINHEIATGLRKKPEPGFIKIGYRSIKEKTCFRVEFK